MWARRERLGLQPQRCLKRRDSEISTTIAFIPVLTTQLHKPYQSTKIVLLNVSELLAFAKLYRLPVALRQRTM